MPTNKGFSFSASLSVDEETGRVRAVYFRIRPGKSKETREIIDGRVLADYDGGGQLLGVEMLAPCEFTVFDSIADAEPEERLREPIRRFLRTATPSGLAGAGCR
jgi:uncharacterized protein YuzE